MTFIIKSLYLVIGDRRSQFEKLFVLNNTEITLLKGESKKFELMVKHAHKSIKNQSRFTLQEG